MITRLIGKWLNAGVLEQGQRARLVSHLGHDVTDQARLERHTDPAAGLDDGSDTQHPISLLRQAYGV